MFSSYEGQNVVSVSLAGRPNVDGQRLLAAVPQKPGTKFVERDVRAGAAALKREGNFETVRIRVEPEPNGVSVRYVLEPATYYGIFRFTGAERRFGYARLVQITNYPPRGAFDAVDVQAAADDLVQYFNRNGYFLAEVSPKVQVDQQNGLVNIDFVTSLGRRAKFGKVNIEGPTADETRHLEGVLHSFLARLRGAAIRPGKTYKLRTLQNATDYLNRSLAKQGHLDAKVKLVGAKYNADSNRADISFNVQPGPIIHVKTAGAHLWPWTKKKLIPVYAGIGVDPEVIQEGERNIVSYFQNKGYFDAKVTSNVQRQGDGETVSYQITKGPRHKVEAVSIAGNTKLSDDDLAQYLKVKKAHFFNHGDFSQKLVAASATNLENVYKANGYSAVKVTPQVKNDGGDISVVFNVDEGPRDIVDALNIKGNDTMTPAQFAPDGLKLAPGQPYSQQFANEDRNVIMAHYLNAGYLNASFRETVKAVPKQPHRVMVTYEITEGPQVMTANIITVGKEHTQQRLISRSAMQIQPNRPLTQEDIYTAQTNLYNDNVFDWAEIDPRRQITTQTKEDVVVKVHEAPRNQLTYGFGFEVINRGGSVPSGTVVVPGLPAIGLNKNFKTAIKTFYGPRGTFQYTRTNIRGKNETASVSLFAGRLDQRFSGTFTDPSFRWSSWAQSFQISAEANQENPIFSSRIASFGYELKKPLDRNKEKTVFFRYRFQQTGISRLTIPELVPAEDQHVKLSQISAAYVRDTRDNALDAHKGIYESAEFTLIPKALGSSVDFARFFGQTSYYKKIPANIIWANSLRIGVQAPFAGSHVPVSELYFTGGGSTLRGFSLDGAGPQRFISICGSTQCFPTLVPIGGNQLFILNSELRIPVDQVKKGLGVVGFYDGGNVYRSVGFSNFFSNFTHSVGIGFRYATPVGPVRIDIGHVLNSSPAIIGTIPPGVSDPTGAIKTTNYFITIGQAF